MTVREYNSEYDRINRVKYLLEKAQKRLSNDCDDNIYNNELRDACVWWLTSTENEKEIKREKVFKRGKLYRKLFIKPPQFKWYNNYLYKKVEKYEAWEEVFKIADANNPFFV